MASRPKGRALPGVPRHHRVPRALPLQFWYQGFIQSGALFLCSNNFVRCHSHSKRRPRSPWRVGRQATARVDGKGCGVIVSPHCGGGGGVKESGCGSTCASRGGGGWRAGAAAGRFLYPFLAPCRLDIVFVRLERLGVGVGADSVRRPALTGSERRERGQGDVRIVGQLPVIGK